MMPACEVRSLTVRNGPGFTLGPVSFALEPGQCLGLLGENGSGKSTLIRAISDPFLGNHPVFLNGQSVAGLSAQRRAQLVATVPQTVQDHMDFTVRETVALGRTPYIDGLWESFQDRLIIERCLETVDLLELGDRLISQISGGERQRALIARALAQEAPVLILDEPTSHLDIRHHQLLQLLLSDLKKQGIALIVASHDVNWLIDIADFVLTLKEGRQISFDLAKDLTEGVLSQVFCVPFACHQVGDKTRFLPF